MLTSPTQPDGYTALQMPDLAKDFLLRQGIAFFNHGSFGACPQPVFEVYQRWQRELEAQPVEFLGRRFSDLWQAARARLADYVGTSSDNLIFIPNATYGVNIVTRSLKLEPGDEILGTNHEYGATQQAWRFVCQNQAARYIAQPISLPVKDVQTVIDQFWAGVTNQTRVIFLSHITSPTALILPIKEICQRAQEAGILTVIDGAHAPGQLELALDALGADFYTGNCHKWLCAPKGSAFLYAKPERQSLLAPLVVGWGWGNERPDSSPFRDHFEWPGTYDPAAYFSVPAAIDYQAEHNWPQVRAACHQLGCDMRAQIQTITGLPHLYSDSETWWRQMFIVPLPPCDPAEVKNRLWQEFQVELPVFEWEGHILMRVSIQGYNNSQDVDRLLKGVQQIFRAGG